MNHNTLTLDNEHEVPLELTDGALEQGETPDVLSEKLRDLSESLNPRIEKAVDESEFEGTAEVREAIKSYYNDHYKSALIIEQVINGEPVNPGILAADDTEMESFDITESLEKIITEQDRQIQFEQLNEFISKKLFAESAVGQTTIGEQEMQLIIGLGNQLATHAQQENVYLREPVTEEMIFENREKATRRFWQDGRAAGQLEFHNTPFPDMLAQDGFKLRTKPNQVEASGDYNSVTGDIANHSQSIHFSEEFYTDGYKSIQGDKEVNEVTIGATIAIPLAKIIEQTPYARGGEYGIARLKDGKSAEVTIHDKANVFAENGLKNGGGEDIYQGQDGSDRTFYADKYDRQKGENYALDFGAATRSSVGNTAHVLFLQRDIDMAHREQFMRDGRNVDARTNYGLGENIPNVEVINFDHARRVDQFAGDKAIQPGAPFIEESHHGYDANLRDKPFAVPDGRLSRTLNENLSYQDGETFESQAARVKERIMELQKQSREHPDFKDKFVVMLRAGTMAYSPLA